MKPVSILNGFSYDAEWIRKLKQPHRMSSKGNQIFFPVMARGGKSEKNKESFF